jgi:hypothetical protein
MSDSVPPAEGEPIGVVSSGWLRAARCSALICTIALGVGFVAGVAAQDRVALIMFGFWGLLSITLLYLLLRRGKNSLAFALGLGAAPAFIALLALVSLGLSRISEVFRHLLFILFIFGGGLPPFPDMMRQDSPQLATLGAFLLALFSISSVVLVLSSLVAFQKMAHEAKGMGKLRLAFGAGICCAPVVWLIFMLLRLSLGGGFSM